MVSGMLLSCKAASTSLGLVPGSFAALMDLYERNYILVRRLVPQLPASGNHLISEVAEGLDLHLQVYERHRYTSDLVLTYRFCRPEGFEFEPDLNIRVYHDARVAEVRAAHLRGWPAFPAFPSGLSQKNCLYARWRVNRFLFKWLGYCLHQGHCFDATQLELLKPNNLD
jgi:uncharacterized protein YqiB (DUF1249 family)